MIYNLFTLWLPWGLIISVTCLEGWLIYLAIRGDSIKDKSYFQQIINYFKDFVK